jgi:hypothetical protein
LGIQGIPGIQGPPGIQGIQGGTGAEGKQGPIGPAGIATVTTATGGTTVITGPAGKDGKNGIVEYQVEQILDGMNAVILPNAADFVKNGLYYYKNDTTDTDTVFTQQNGLVVGKFYSNHIQNITFFKAGNMWIN